MSAKKTDIEQIRKYLQGELKNGAMHKLERRTQDDPFFAEAMEGYESAKADQEANYIDLQARMAERLEREKDRSIFLWRILPLAACLLIALLLGYWILKPQSNNRQLAININKAPSSTSVRPTVKAIDTGSVAAHIQSQSINPVVRHNAGGNNAAVPKSAVASNTFKPDTIDNFNNYADSRAVKEKKAADILKAIPSIKVDSNGYLAANSSVVSRARVNGKDFMGGNIQQATKNLPADVLQKIQVIDDYGDQASKKQSNALKEVTANSLSVQSAPALGILPSTRTITGKVTANDGSALPGAMVKASDGSTKTVTNVNGEYTITLPANVGIDVAYIGFNSQSIKKINGNKADVVLNPAEQSLSEVVVVGYGTQKRTDVTGSVAEVAAQPLGGMKAYDDYLKKAAVMPDGETGSVRVGFTVGDTGRPENIYVISGKNKAMNEKAIQIIENGPGWVKGNNNEEIKLRIRFRKVKS